MEHTFLAYNTPSSHGAHLSVLAIADELEGEIDGKMVSLFNRLKQLEDTNLQLEQSNETLKSKLGGGGEPL